MFSFIARRVVVITIIVSCCLIVFPQMKIDDFGRISNDELLARVENFQQMLSKNEDADALVVLYGTRMGQYLTQRRIEGCSMMRRYPLDRLKYVFGPIEHEPITKFYLAPKNARITVDQPDYKLPDLQKPIELNNAFSTDEFCPLHFDLDWFSHFMNANPEFRGKVMIDSPPGEFVRRVKNYRKKLDELGTSSSRVKFFRRSFLRERDEQWWLIPSKRK